MELKIRPNRFLKIVRDIKQGASMAIPGLARTVLFLFVVGLPLGVTQAATPDGVLSDSIAERVIAAWGDRPAGIIVHVSDGVVEMWGEAPSESAVSEAVTIARNTVGVQQVVSHLQVGSRQGAQQQARLQSSAAR
jgi:hypothetical protein